MNHDFDGRILQLDHLEQGHVQRQIGKATTRCSDKHASTPFHWFQSLLAYRFPGPAGQFTHGWIDREDGPLARQLSPLPGVVGCDLGAFVEAVNAPKTLTAEDILDIAPSAGSQAADIAAALNKATTDAGITTRIGQVMRRRMPTKLGAWQAGRAENILSADRDACRHARPPPQNSPLHRLSAQPDNFFGKSSSNAVFTPRPCSRSRQGVCSSYSRVLGTTVRS